MGEGEVKRTPMPPRKKPMARQLVLVRPKREVSVSVGRGNAPAAVHAVLAWAQRPPVAIPKTLTFRSEPHRRLVAGMHCIACGRVGYSQCAHMNGGGGAMKHDDRLTFPLCADGPGWRGCHMNHDQPGQGARGKLQRRRLEAVYVLLTVRELVDGGQWFVPMLSTEQMQELERWAT